MGSPTARGNESGYCDKIISVPNKRSIGCIYNSIHGLTHTTLNFITKLTNNLSPQIRDLPKPTHWKISIYFSKFSNSMFSYLLTWENLASLRVSLNVHINLLSLKMVTHFFFSKNNYTHMEWSGVYIYMCMCIYLYIYLCVWLFFKIKCGNMYIFKQISGVLVVVFFFPINMCF